MVATAQQVSDVRASYEKHEYQIPMRDGVKLFTSVYVPRNATRPYSILLTRTPYGVGPYGAEVYPRRLGYSPELENQGAIFAFQDVRGRYMSEGTFVHMTPHRDVKRGVADIDESTDTYDTIDWLVKHVEPNNGRVGLWGISYPGFFAAAGAIEAHPALTAVSPQAPQADWFAGDDTHHNGAFFLAATFDFMAQHGRIRPVPTTERPRPFTFGTPDGYQFFLEMGPLPNADARHLHGQSPGWTEMMEHGTYDRFWRARNLLPHLRGIRPAVMTVGGWYDSNNLYGALHVFQAIEQQSPNTTNTLVIGPWAHGQWAVGDGEALGPLLFEAKTSLFFREQVERPFFEQYLIGSRDARLPKALVFETGRNRWRTFDRWPPRDVATRFIFLREEERLSFDPPRTASRSAFDEYVSDPARPVPYIEALRTDMSPNYMVQDQRFAATRPDVLVYRTEVLAEDITIAGPITPRLFVSTSGTDADWIVKLIDVYPDDAPDAPAASAQTSGIPPRPVVHMKGFQRLVRGDVMRGKFRNSFEKPEPFVPGKVTRVEFPMPDVLHTFLKGHRIMVHIQSSWFPLVDRNPQAFVDIYHASASNYQKATQRVYRSGDRCSSVGLNVVSKGSGK